MSEETFTVEGYNYPKLLLELYHLEREVGELERQRNEIEDRRRKALFRVREISSLIQNTKYEEKEVEDEDDDEKES